MVLIQDGIIGDGDQEFQFPTDGELMIHGLILFTQTIGGGIQDGDGTLVGVGITEDGIIGDGEEDGIHGADHTTAIRTLLDFTMVITEEDL